MLFLLVFNATFDSVLFTLETYRCWLTCSCPPACSRPWLWRFFRLMMTLMISVLSWHLNLTWIIHHLRLVLQVKTPLMWVFSPNCSHISVRNHCKLLVVSTFVYGRGSCIFLRFLIGLKHGWLTCQFLPMLGFLQSDPDGQTSFDLGLQFLTIMCFLLSLTCLALQDMWYWQTYLSPRDISLSMVDWSLCILLRLRHFTMWQSRSHCESVVWTLWLEHICDNMFKDADASSIMHGRPSQSLMNQFTTWNMGIPSLCGSRNIIHMLQVKLLKDLHLLVHPLMPLLQMMLLHMTSLLRMKLLSPKFGPLMMKPWKVSMSTALDVPLTMCLCVGPLTIPFWWTWHGRCGCDYVMSLGFTTWLPQRSINMMLKKGSFYSSWMTFPLVQLANWLWLTLRCISMRLLPHLIARCISFPHALVEMTCSCNFISLTTALDKLIDVDSIGTMLSGQLTILIAMTHNMAFTFELLSSHLMIKPMMRPLTMK